MKEVRSAPGSFLDLCSPEHHSHAFRKKKTKNKKPTDLEMLRCQGDANSCSKLIQVNKDQVSLTRDLNTAESMPTPNISHPP